MYTYVDKNGQSPTLEAMIGLFEIIVKKKKVDFIVHFLASIFSLSCFNSVLIKSINHHHDACFPENAC